MMMMITTTMTMMIVAIAIMVVLDVVVVQACGGSWGEFGWKRRDVMEDSWAL